MIKKIKANAKINIGLNVINKREDAYHNLDMTMLPINLYDHLEIDFKEKKGNLYISSNIDTIPLDETNIIFKIYKKFYEYTKLKTEEIYVDLKKIVPFSAGLGGGSSDGAFFLNVLNSYHNQILTEDEMINLSKKVGADIPFFLVNKSSRIGGIGEKILPIVNNLEAEILLIKPNFGVSTKSAYSSISKLKNKKVSNIDLILKGLKENKLSLVLENIENTIEQALIQENKELRTFKKNLEETFNLKFFMSGSGSSYFTLLEKGKASFYLEKANDKFSDCFISVNNFL